MLFYRKKISKIREELDIMETDTPSKKGMNTRRDTHGPDSFEPVTEVEINEIL